MATAVEPNRPRLPGQRIDQRILVERKTVAQLPDTPVVFACENVEVFYGSFRAVRCVTLRIQANQITAFIGPSGCGKTTMLRSLILMHDVIPGARVAGRVSYHGVDLYAPEASATAFKLSKTWRICTLMSPFDCLTIP